MSGSLSSLLAVIFLTLLPPLAPAQNITIAAAADLAPLQTEIEQAVRKIEPNLHLTFVIGASAILKQQIQNGAPYDVFLSANAAYVDQLASSRKIEPISVCIYTRGRVGVLWKDGKHHPLSDLRADSVRSVALPNPRLAPYGAAAVDALARAGLWEFVSKKAVYGENVRQAYQMFASGNADAVLTSATLLEGKPADLLPPSVEQKAGVVADRPNQKAAEEFVRKLTGPELQAVFARHGFAKP
jgi:molybdate transport system substrate-binding protein